MITNTGDIYSKNIINEDTLSTNTITSDNTYINIEKGISTKKYLSLGNNNYNITTDGGLCIGNFATTPYNDGVFKIGIGTDNNNRKTGLLFDNNGVLTVNDKIITNDLQSKNGNNIIKIYDNSIVVSKDGGTNWSGLISAGAGTNSVILNNSSTNTASGDDSYTEGSQNTALGNQSHAEGFINTASGNFSHAEGYETQAKEEAAHSEGYRTKATGFRAHAEGYDTVASGNQSHASGRGTYADQINMTAIGSFNTQNNTNALFVVGNGEDNNNRSDAFVVYNSGNTEINGDTEINGNINTKGYITSINATNTYYQIRLNPLINKIQTTINGGESWTDYGGGGGSGVGQVYINEGDGTQGGEIFNDYSNNKAISENTHAEGSNTTAGKRTITSGTGTEQEPYVYTYSGQYSHAEGFGTQATGVSSHAEGFETHATQEAAHSEGYNTNATGIYSHAEGSNTNATGDYSHTEGNNTYASGESSHAEGKDTEASARYSHASGLHTISETEAGTAIGKYNISGNNKLFVVGNGTINDDDVITRSDAFVVYDNGDTEINGSLKLGGFTVSVLGNTLTIQ